MKTVTFFLILLLEQLSFACDTPTKECSFYTQNSPCRVIKEEQKKKKIECRWICNEKLYKEQQIAKAISFYKNSKYYHFKQ